MTVHPEVLWAQRSSDTQAEKVFRFFISRKFVSFLMSVDAAEYRICDDQLA